MKAYCLIRPQPHYRSEAFVAGLKAAGYRVSSALPIAPRPGDILVIWNRYFSTHDLALEFERRGGMVIVAENGYLGMDRRDRQVYSMALHAHNGRGVWPHGGSERFAALGVTLKPWRETGEHVLVAPNRSFGMPGGIMPEGWANQVAEQLRKITKRPVRIRPHPGNGEPMRPLADDLRDAWAVVIWSSSVGVTALTEGIPVFCCAPWWICRSAAQTSITDIDGPIPEAADRLRRYAMERLAWAQWNLSEISDGTAFNHLLRTAREGQVAPSA